MKKTLLILAACAALTHAATAQTPTPTPTPTPVPVQSSDELTISVRNIPLPVVEALRASIVASGAFAFPTGLEARPVKSLMLNVTGTNAAARIVLGPPVP
jgi:hypothetical protein